MTTVEFLHLTREKIAEEAAWCKGTYATNSAGVPVLVSDRAACMWCILGALDITSRPYNDIARYEAQRFLEASLPPNLGNAALSEFTCVLGAFNDRPETKHQDVLDLFDRAIAKLLAKDT